METLSQVINDEMEVPKPVVITLPPTATLKDVERAFILMVLERTGNNKTKTAKELGVTVKTLYNKLHEYGVFEDFKNQKSEVKNNAI